MVPTAEQTAANRQLLAGSIRLVAMILVAIAMYMWAYEIEYAYYRGIMSGGLASAALVVWSAMSWAPLVLIAVAGVFLCVPNRVARVLVRLPKVSLCPGCGYSLETLPQLRCPECGLELSENFRPRENDSDPAA